MALVGVLGLLGGAVIALAGAGQEVAPEFVPPSWSRPASPAFAQQMHPPFAAMIGVGGVATVKCMAPSDGPPTECSVVRVAPEGLGFGEAALRIVASTEIRAARLGGSVSPRWVQTNINFLPPDPNASREWTGPGPSAARLALAEKLSDMMEAMLPPPPRDLWMVGLDAERREVVRPWIEELMPRSRVREREIRTLQLARLFTEIELQRLIERKHVDMPSAEEILAACPEATPEDLAALAEIRRRYCERYQCAARPE